MEASNKLIAEFMGLETTFNEISDATLYTYKGIEEASAITFVVDVELYEMRYHLSWDWLMPVIEKCYVLDTTTYYRTIHYSMESFDIEKVYIEVVDFIKNFNN